MKRAVAVAAFAGWVLAVVADPASAHAGSLSASQESLAIPTWLFLMTGGGAVGASFLLASFVTDRAFIRAIDGWSRVRSLPSHDRLTLLGRMVGLAVLAVTIGVGSIGPRSANGNLAILLVWVFWWAGFTMSTYLLGNSWPVLNPFRTIAEMLPSFDRSYPDRLGAWPSVLGLLLLIWIEIVSPIATDPRALVALLSIYGVLTIAGAVVFGSAWFRRVDPIARVFRFYGLVAPLTFENGRLRLRIPGTGLTETRLIDGIDEVAFVIALLWGTTFDGLVATPGWAALARTLVASGVPPEVLYPVGLAVGFALFFGIYRFAAVRSRASARTYRSAGDLAVRFAPSLLAIAAGYHLAHYLDYFISLVPSLLVVAGSPLSPPALIPQLVLPGWIGGLSLAFVLVGHVLAIWVAHTTAYETFPGRLQAIRSQYALTAVMIFYTAVSLWVVSQPFGVPPYT